MSKDLILRYLRATTNLYGIIPPEKVVEIYNQQNESSIDVEDLEPYKALENEFFSFFDECFAHEALFVDDSFAELWAQQGNKPYYIPAKEELLRFADDLYIEKPAEYNQLYEFILKNYIDDPTAADELTEDILFTCALDFSMQAVMDEFTRRKVIVKGRDQLSELLPLITGLANNTRIWDNRGHTPNEIFTKFQKPHLKPLPSGGFPYLETNPKSVNMPRLKGKKSPAQAKTGRNDPCPCGSGRKYKKCCMLDKG